MEDTCLFPLNLHVKILEVVVVAVVAEVAALFKKLAMLVYAGFLTRLDDHKHASPDPEKVEGTHEYWSRQFGKFSSTSEE